MNATEETQVLPVVRHAAPRRRTWLILVSVLIGVVIIAAGITFGVLQASENSQLQTRNDQLSNEISLLQAGLSSDESKLANLQSTVSNLNVPTDPLANYNEVCSGPVTNDSTGQVQTYYYPCTNQAQTIPQPGN